MLQVVLDRKRPDPILELLHLELLGQGVALLPDWVVRHASPSPLLVTRPIEGLRLTRTWAFVCAKWTLPNLPVRTFRRLCQQAVVGLAADAARTAQPVAAALSLALALI